MDMNDGLEAENMNNQEESEEVSESDRSSETSDSDDMTWITWFINLKGHECFIEVDTDYIQDDFNLTGLNTMVPFFDYALDLVLDLELPVGVLQDEQLDIVETAAEVLYGLIHARYILTAAGMQRMNQKFQLAQFGRCPRVYCQGQPVLPIGLSDLPRSFSMNIFCPRCQQLYYPRSSKQTNLDGSYFGTTFAHLFLLTNPDLIPPRNQPQTYVPRIYGFRINQESIYYKQRDTQTSSTNSANTKKRNGTTNDDAAVHPPSPVLTVGKAVAPTSTVKSVSDKDRMKQHERISEVV